MAGPRILGEVVRGQLDQLVGWAALPPPVAGQLGGVFEALTAGAMARSAIPPFDGLSRINANGLPFQWSFSLAPGGARSVRFLCEPGVPGTSARERYAFARNCLARALDGIGTPYPDWLDDCVFAHCIPAGDAWPDAWRSALWFGVGAARGGVLIKPYLNLNHGTPLERWRRLGRVLLALGRHDALATLCGLSGQVSRDSWPVGLALDILPDGGSGRVKMYFRAAAVDPGWLQRWYAATGGAHHAPLVRAALDAFPYCGHARYPERAFVVSLECHDVGVALKTDLGVTRWMHDDAAIAAGSRRVLRAIGAEAAELETALTALGAWPPDATACRHLRFVGLGHEPDGASHLNLYVEPPLQAPVARTRPARARTLARARRDGCAFLVAGQRDGLWRDYLLPVGVADQWITAYVAWMVADLPGGASDAACAALLRLGEKRGGWGYHAKTGKDADSTSLAILALRACGWPVPPAALAFLDQCRAADGGMGTYPAGSTPGGTWCAGSAEVSAAACLALGGDARLAAFLARQRGPSGLWPAYWWHTPLYPTWLALRALPCPPHDALIDTLRQYEPLGAFETALLLLCCLEMGLDDRTHTLAQALVEEQLEDGSWPASAWLRLTDTAVATPAEVIAAGPSYADVARVFTSATVLAALHAHEDQRRKS